MLPASPLGCGEDLGSLRPLPICLSRIWRTFCDSAFHNTLSATGHGLSWQRANRLQTVVSAIVSISGVIERSLTRERDRGNFFKKWQGFIVLKTFLCEGQTSSLVYQ